MRLLTLALLLTALSVPSAAQTVELPNQWAGAGVFFNQYASPQINGTAAYAKRIVGKGTYSFSAVNFLSYQKSPFQLMTTCESGVAQYLTKFGVFHIYALGTLGVAATSEPALLTAPDAEPEGGGTKIGMSFTGGTLAFARFENGMTLGPVLRISRQTISGNQWAAGLMVGWGE